MQNPLSPRNLVTTRTCAEADCGAPLVKHVGRGRPRIRCEACSDDRRVAYLRDYKKDWGEHKRAVAQFRTLHGSRHATLGDAARYRNFLVRLVQEADMADSRRRQEGAA